MSLCKSTGGGSQYHTENNTKHSRCLNKLINRSKYVPAWELPVTYYTWSWEEKQQIGSNYINQPSGAICWRNVKFSANTINEQLAAPWATAWNAAWEHSFLEMLFSICLHRSPPPPREPQLSENWGQIHAALLDPQGPILVNTDNTNIKESWFSRPGISSRFHSIQELLSQ